jgi:hypothetical protein
MGFIADFFGATNEYNMNEGLPSDFKKIDYATALQQALKGINTPQLDPTMANQTAGQQDSLIAALNGQLAGNGPSVAQQQLNQALTQNQASTASAIGSTRGMNPAAAARLILQTQAGQAQDAAGQGALLRAQEVGGIQNALAGVLANKRAQDIGQAANTAQIGLEGLNSQTQRMNTLGSLQNTQNANVVQNRLGAGQINANIAQQNANTRSGVIGGIMSGAAEAMGMMSGGGGMAYGGEVAKVPGALEDPGSEASTAAGGNVEQGIKDFRKIIRSMFGGMNDGGVVPGTPTVPGDSFANDKVPAMLSPGEIVIPRTMATPDKAKEFVAAVKGAKPTETKKKKVDFSDVLASQRRLEERLGRMEFMAYGGMVKG